MKSLAVVALTMVAACLPRGQAVAPAQSQVSEEASLVAVWARAQLAQYTDTPAGADDNSRASAQLASEAGMPHLNDVAWRVRYNGTYFEVDVVVDGAHGVVPVPWQMLRAHTALTGGAYYARVYTSRGRVSGYQIPNRGPVLIVPEACTPELTPVLFAYFQRAYIDWNVNFNGWTQGNATAWMKTAAIQVARVWTPELVGGFAVLAARARITGRAALGAAAVPGAAEAAAVCSRGRCPCFVAGTPVATADGPVAIERVAVGQRVLPTSPACTGIDGGELIAYRLELRGAGGDVFAIALLRGRDWPRAPGARPGDRIYIELDELNVRGWALVTARDSQPQLDADPRRGCLVTGTVTHTAQTLTVLRLAGEDEPIVATPWHRMYSDTRDGWVAIEELAAGELLRTSDGVVAVESVIERGDQREPVFNLEVAGSHRYYVHDRHVLTHNTYGSGGGIIRATELLRPGGRLIGKAGSSSRIRILQGGRSEANALFTRLVRESGATLRNKPGLAGFAEIPGGGSIGLRFVSTSGPPTIDVRIPGLRIREIKFLP